MSGSMFLSFSTCVVQGLSPCLTQRQANELHKYIWHWLGHERGLCPTPDTTGTALEADPLRDGQHMVGRVPQPFSLAIKQTPSIRTLCRWREQLYSGLERQGGGTASHAEALPTLLH